MKMFRCSRVALSLKNREIFVRVFLLFVIYLTSIVSCYAIETNAVVIKVFEGDNLSVLAKSIATESIDLIYIDPPYNTGKVQIRERFETKNGERTEIDTYGFEDSYDDYIGFLEPRIKEAYRVLKRDGSIFVHVDYREVHYVKIMMDKIFGRRSFMNEIIWVYDFGGRSKSRWSPKHDNILWYAKNPKHYTYNYEAIDRIPYMAPGMVSEEKAAKGKTPTDVWWNTIVSPTGKEKTGYATQKPRAIVDRIIAVHSNPGDICLDFFAGSGTLGESAYLKQRNSILVDINPDAISVMRKRFSSFNVEWNASESCCTSDGCGGLK